MCPLSGLAAKLLLRLPAYRGVCLRARLALMLGLGSIALAAPNPGMWIDRTLSFHSGTLDGWIVTKPEAWSIRWNPAPLANPTDMPRYVIDTQACGDVQTGALRSPIFTIKTANQKFSIAGWDSSTTGTNTGQLNYVFLLSHPECKILRQTHTPGQNNFAQATWDTSDLIGRQVYLEVVDGNTRREPHGCAWIGFADYRQDNPADKQKQTDK